MKNAGLWCWILVRWLETRVEHFLRAVPACAGLDVAGQNPGLWPAHSGPLDRPRTTKATLGVGTGGRGASGLTCPQAAAHGSTLLPMFLFNTLLGDITPCARLFSRRLFLAGLALRAGALWGQAPLTLEQIMADPDWSGNAPEAPLLSADGTRAYFQRKEAGKELRSLWSVPLAGGPMEKLTPAAAAAAESAERIFSADRSQAAWLRGGNVFLWSSRGATQLTRTGEETDLLTFLASGEVAFRAAPEGVSLLHVALALRPLRQKSWSTSDHP